MRSCRESTGSKQWSWQDEIEDMGSSSAFSFVSCKTRTLEDQKKLDDTLTISLEVLPIDTIQMKETANL
jgi:hypothetical protein